MKKLLIYVLMVACIASCKEVNENNLRKEDTIDGLYEVQEPKEEAGNIYVFSKDELSQFIDFDKENKGKFDTFSTFFYYIKNNKIYTCMKGVMICKDKIDYDEHYTIKSIDTVEKNQIIILQSKSYPIIKLSKSIDK